jgi:SEC-C motif
MSLFPAEKIKPFLVHETKRVRSKALSYFSESYSRDSDVMPLVLTACERWGSEKNIRLLSMADDLVQTEETLRGVASVLAGADHPLVQMQCSCILGGAPPDLQELLRGDILGCANVTSSTRERIDRRLELRSRDPEFMWDELLGISAASWGKQLAPEMRWHATDLVDELAQRRSYSDEEFVEFLADPVHSDEWMECFIIDLVGKSRAAGAIPALVARMRLDEDVLRDWCALALRRIGGPEVGTAIRSNYRGASFWTKMWLLGVAEHLPCPEAEEFLLRLLKKEWNVDLRTQVVMALLNLLSDAAVDEALKMVSEGYDKQAVVLEEEIVYRAEIMDVDFPERAKWAQEADERERHFDAILDREDAEVLNREASPESPGEKLFTEDEDREQRPEPDPIEAQTQAQAQAQAQAPKRKVGRNTPCPCGSGRKYKRCCGAG